MLTDKMGRFFRATQSPAIFLRYHHHLPHASLFGITSALHQWQSNFNIQSLSATRSTSPNTGITSTNAMIMSFQDRPYLEKDWGEHFCNESISPNGKVLLEDGCGAGNAIFPFWLHNPIFMSMLMTCQPMQSP